MFYKPYNLHKIYTMKDIDNTWKNKKVAIVCDWIWDWWGAEIVLEQLLELLPDADIFSSVFWQADNPIFQWKKITTSGIQKFPILNKKHKLASILRPQAFESFDLRDYDIVISSSSAESKWVITKPNTLHICYCHTPTRYFWSHYHEYKNMMEFWILNPIAKFFMPWIIHKLRAWDYCAAQRPDIFIANSKNTQSRIKKYYNRNSHVIYPCLNLDSIPYSQKKQDYYFYAWRVIPYKKFDLVIDAFNQNGLSLKIAANTDNKLARELQKKSKPNIEWIFETNNKKINKLHANAKAFLFPPEEDFGLVPIAAMATWTPVIAYWKWWALETINHDTWIFFDQQTPESLNTAIQKFENMKFDPKKIRSHAQNFDKSVFKSEFIKMIKKNLK